MVFSQYLFSLIPSLNIFYFNPVLKSRSLLYFWSFNRFHFYPAAHSVYMNNVTTFHVPLFPVLSLIIFFCPLFWVLLSCSPSWFLSCYQRRTCVSGRPVKMFVTERLLKFKRKWMRFTSMTFIFCPCNNVKDIYKVTQYLYLKYVVLLNFVHQKIFHAFPKICYPGPQN